MSNKKPIAKISLYPVTAAIWRNQAEGENTAFFTVTFERSYKDNAGNWRSGDSFGARDLLLLAKVADLAHSEIHKLQAAEKQMVEDDE